MTENICDNDTNNNNNDNINDYDNDDDNNIIDDDNNDDANILRAFKLPTPTRTPPPPTRPGSSSRRSQMGSTSRFQFPSLPILRARIINAHAEEMRAQKKWAAHRGSSFRRSQSCARAEEMRARRINVRAEEMRARRINARAE